MLWRLLQEEIKIAKNYAWSDMAEAVESDLWGRPYRTVRRKLSSMYPLATTVMELALLTKVIGTLFPSREDTAMKQPHETAA